MIKLRTFILLIFVFSGLENINAQQDTVRIISGNVNAAGTNPGAEAKIHLKPGFVAKLPSALNETSGLVYFNGQLWTINDGGNEPALSRIDTTSGSVLRRVMVSNTKNIDWESITQDDSSIYIGDFGNNYGSRKNLRILKIEKCKLLDPSNDSVEAGLISFEYADQVDFSPRLNQTNFDCEAFFYHNDSLHLFSKNWGDQQTRHYVLPSVTGKYTACLIETFNAGGLITDAAINGNGEIVLLGYKNTGGKFWNCFLWVFRGNDNNRLAGKMHTRIELGSALNLGQTEGLAFGEGNRLWISSERITSGWVNLPAKLFQADISKYF